MKRTNPTEKPYLSWCLIVRNSNPDLLRAMFESVRARTPEAEIVVVDTMSAKDSPAVAICKEFADVWAEYAGPNGDWTRDMYAFDDAAAARTYAFELASGTWRAWIDDDDVLPDPAECERLLKLNNRWKPVRTGQKVEDGEAPTVGLVDFLHGVEEKLPLVTMIFCPYLYQRDEHDLAITWQERERFVRWLGKDGKPQFKWAEAGHEVMVPISHIPPRVDLAHLVFRHDKKFDASVYEYSVKRHFEAIHKLYNQPGGRTTRRCLYLANFAGAGGVCPEREWEFLQAAHEIAATALDRYRCLIDIGHYYGSRGLYWDAMESFCGAQGLRPDLPDAWFAAAERAINADDHVRAVRWLEAGLACELHPESLINPRWMVTRYPTLLQLQLRKLSRKQIQQGGYNEALQSLGKAAALAKAVMESESVGEDLIEAKVRCYRAENEYKAHLAMMNLRTHFYYLRDNDESAKAVELLSAIPWNCEDHPIAVELEVLSEPVVDHLNDPSAYTRFYETEASGFFPTQPEQMEDADRNPRAFWAAAWIGALKPSARIFEVGPCDGTFAIPILRTCPGVTYLGYELTQEAIDGFKKNAEHYGVADRVELVKIKMGDPYPGEATHWDSNGTFDIVLYGEVIEHVQDPIGELRRLHDLLKDDGLLILTTPWGSFDAGHPPECDNYGKPRGHLGHVRALSARDVNDLLIDAELEPIEMMDIMAGEDAYIGHNLCAIAARGDRRDLLEPAVKFCVAGALWDWNSRIVEAGGIGASEETIVYLARHWANAEPARNVEVFGPTPRPDIHFGVPYWPKEQLRHLKGIEAPTKLVVSRAPAWGVYLDQQIGERLPKILWLQDAFYPDLNPEVAAEYETIVVLTEWHKQQMHKLHEVPLDKMQVIPNFLLPEQFLQPVERKRDHFIYASSPDRGLIRLLELWPRILDRYPDATLDIFYGWKGCETLSRTSPDWAVVYRQMRSKYEKLRWQKGIRERGMVNHQAIARAYLRAGVWAYPTHFAETFCSNAIKARAAGAIPVTVDLAALAETAACEQAVIIPHGDPDGTDKFVEGCFYAVEAGDDVRRPMMEEARERYKLSAIVPLWDRVVEK